MTKNPHRAPSQSPPTSGTMGVLFIDFEIELQMHEQETKRMEKLTMLCTCDDNCDSPCPCHERENQLQDEVILLRNRSRLAAQTLIAKLGASGPEDVEHAATRAVKRIKKLEDDLFRLRCDIKIWQRTVVELTHEKYVALVEVDCLKESLGK